MKPVMAFGSYEVQETLGQGGMGRVYKAWDPVLRRHVAIKTLLPELIDDTESRQRFLREAQSVASLTHPNITQIFTISEEKGHPYFAMEFVDGCALSDLLEKSTLPPLKAIEIVSQAARGLQEAQRKGIVHRDIKPANLLITETGTVKITDFGLAKGVRTDMSLTSVGIVMGSPNYMSPEQGRGENVDHRSDIYSLGVTFFEMLTGRLPFEAATPMAMILKHAREVAPSPKTICPKLSYPLSRVVQRMLNKKPEDRYQNYRGLLLELDAVEKLEKRGPGPRSAGPPAISPRSPSGFPFFPLAVGSLIMISGILFYARRGSTEPMNRPIQTRFRVESLPRTSTPRTPSTTMIRQFGEVLGERKNSARKRPKLEFVETQREILPGLGVRLFGTVHNTGQASAEKIRIKLQALDASGNLLNQGETVLFPNQLHPGQTGFYELFLPTDPPPDTVEAEINWLHQ